MVVQEPSRCRVRTRYGCAQRVRHRCQTHRLRVCLVPRAPTARSPRCPRCRRASRAASRLLAHGVSTGAVARLLANEQWRRLRSGIYLTTGAEPSFAALAWAGVLAAGEPTRLGGTSAAHLQGLQPDPPGAGPRPGAPRPDPGLVRPLATSSVSGPARAIPARWGHRPAPRSRTRSWTCARPRVPRTSWAGRPSRCSVGGRHRQGSSAALDRRRRHPRRALLRALLGDVGGRCRISAGDHLPARRRAAPRPSPRRAAGPLS